MSRPSAIPRYRLHRGTGQAVVTIAGVDHYLGRYGSKQSWVKYDERVGPLVMDRARRGELGDCLTLSDLLAAFWDDYRNRPRATSWERIPDFATYRRLFSILRAEAGDRPAKAFGPLVYRRVRDSMVGRKMTTKGREDVAWSRQYINVLMRHVRHIFRWAASYELIPVAVADALFTVGPLKRGGAVRDTAPVKPASRDLFDAVVKVSRPTLAAMLQLQLYTGMRAGEVCVMRACDIEMKRSGEWIYRPHTHKGRWLGRERVILLGPKAREIVRRFLKPSTTEYLFTSQQLYVEWRAQRRATSKRQEKNDRRAARRRAAGVPPRGAPRMTPRVYRTATLLACEEAFPVPEAIAHDAGAVRAWRREHRLNPLQLRHNFATDARAEGGLEITRQLLGHAVSTTSEIYAERDIVGMSRAASRIG